MLDALIAFIECYCLMIWNSVTDFLHDITIQTFGYFFDAVIALLNLVDPSYYITFSLNDAFSMIPGNTLYFISLLNLDSCFSVIAVGYTVRLIRKIITLFQW